MVDEGCGGWSDCCVGCSFAWGASSLLSCACASGAADAVAALSILSRDAADVDEDEVEFQVERLTGGPAACVGR